MKVAKVLLIIALLSAVACEKEANRKLLNAYFKYDVNGTSINIANGKILNENLFECNLMGDTALQIMVSKVYDGASIFITDKSGIKDGTYLLSDVNKAFYLNPTDVKKYSTTHEYTGSVTIKKSTFQAKSLLNTLEGTFSFNAVDTVTGKNFAITNGAFLMERKQK